MHPKSAQSLFSPSMLEGCTALITGAGKGIGRECAVRLVASGARVIAVARTQTDLTTLKEELGEQLIPMVADASSDEFLQQLAHLKDINILVNNLGTNNPQDLVDVELESLDTMLNTNVRAVIRATQIVVRNMIATDSAGSIINISSQMGHVGSPGRTIYCATKHALEGFTKALAVELAAQRIRVNSVAPTFIDTPLTAPMLSNKEFSEFVLQRIPMGHIGHVADVANAVVYLASEAAALVTGTSLRVDGGWTAQ
ncbi:MAG: SDR family NAD(P)-dependent oxidoreductase [Pseudomonadales bacterium]